jgi:8-oxo-dGTP pyrophosphatase MutT (NUDIX family)
MTRSYTPLSKLPQFDPRQAPVIRHDHHLPAVEATRLSAQALRQRFARPPEWQPEVVRERRFSAREPALAAVLLGIVLRAEPTVLLTQRTAHLSALREAQEEVGLDPAHVEVLGTLSEYVTGSAFIVTPVVGLVDPAHTITPNPHEVDQVFEVPLAYLMNPAHHRRHAFEAEGLRREWFSMPYLDQGVERYIWGATAGMLRNFYRFLSA